MDPKSITPYLHELCDLAEQETLPRFRNLKSVDNKFDDGFDPVTEADRMAELKIRENIGAKYPDHGIFGEEFGATNPDAEYCWIIDPIDGTRAFVAGIPVWGTLIGLYRNGKPYAGIMHQPFTGERYYSDGDSSYLQWSKNRTQLKTSEESALSNSILMTTAPELFDLDAAGKFRKVAEKVQMTRFGADCYAYCQVAGGHVGLVIEAGLQTYDIAALIPIVENAGGFVTDWQGNSAANGGEIIAAANPGLHSAAIELLNGD